jgi:hypothetical protein
MSYALDFFGQVMRDMAVIPEGHVMGVDERGHIIDRGPADVWFLVVALRASWEGCR